MNNDDDLRRLFGDATSEITPTGTLDDIRDRTTKVDPMARKWFLPSMAAAAAMALVIGGAFWATRDSDDGIKTADIAASPSAPVDANIYYVGEGAQVPRLFSERHSVPGGGASALEAVRDAIRGKPLDGDYFTQWPAGVDVDRVEVAEGDRGPEIRINLTGPVYTDVDGIFPQSLAPEAVVRTAQGVLGTRSPVAFYADGQRLNAVLGVTGPTFAPGNDDDVLALVSISNLTDGATVEPGKLTVKGLASTFEANVAWEILVGGDAVIDSGFTTAAEGGTLSPYEFTTNIPLEGPGTYTLVVHDTDESGEGRPVNRDSKEIVVE